ncbi:hypothetical protein Tco_0025011 [Tanacetum coccineum]
MEGLPRCDKLLRSTNTRRWEDAMVLYCHRSVIEDCRQAREISRMCREVGVVFKMAYFLQELNSLHGRRMPEKMAKFMRETQSKDTEKMLQLKILKRETDLRAREKELFIQKLKGVVMFKDSYLCMANWIRHLDDIWRKYTRLGHIWRRNGQDYDSTPFILKNCANKAWRRRRRLQATVSGFSKRQRHGFDDGVRT